MRNQVTIFLPMPSLLTTNSTHTSERVKNYAAPVSPLIQEYNR